MKLTMVGTGYVGLVTGACFSSTGNDVICLDVDTKKIDLLNRGRIPIHEPGLTELIRRNTDGNRLSFTTDKHAAYAEAEAIFICVGTPDDDGTPDLSAVFQAAEDIAQAIDARGPGSSPVLVVVKSTVPVGTTNRVRDLMRDRTKTPFVIANNPEFLKEGAAVGDFMKPDRVVVGVEDETAAGLLRDLYEPFVRQGNPIIIMDVRSSEMVKYASNMMLATKVSFINEIANLCEYHGADIGAVREGMCDDHRIGNQFLYPGLGFGGSCFPKDVNAVINM
ncbi:MAG: UDP-glucose dehydrogenase family protein, partial [Planctomycetota bacterium]